jgi:DNA-binding PadR family transcriptional regulator
VTGMKRAKRSNPLSLAVLVLLYERPMHPYEMASTLRERGKEHSIKLNYGSLYTVIELLLRAGFLRVQQILREGRRPEKTIYELTPAGEFEMTEWLREIIGTPIKEYPQFEAGLSLLPALPPEQAVPLLVNRAKLLKDRLGSLKEGFRKCEEMKLPRLFSIETEFHEALTRAECQYVESLVHDIQSDTDGLKHTWMEVRKVLSKPTVADKPKKKKNEKRGET